MPGRSSSSAQVLGRRTSALVGIVAVGALLGGALAATTPARAAGLNLDLDQWAPLNAAWQNGDLNGNNASFPEGGVVPFRLAIENIAKGKHTFHINYDFTAGGHKAYDYLATWNATTSPKLCDPKGGAISSLCPSLGGADTKAFPSDPFKANGLSVAGAEEMGKVPRRLTLYGGSITAIAGPVHAGGVNGNSTADITVTFVADGSAVLFAWGGHLAMSKYWDVAAGGEVDGAGQVSGAPWHMRTLQFDGAGNRNQDRSIQPSAISGSYEPPTSSSGQPPRSSGSSSGPRKTPIPWELAPETDLAPSYPSPGFDRPLPFLAVVAGVIGAAGGAAGLIALAVTASRARRRPRRGG